MARPAPAPAPAPHCAPHCAPVSAMDRVALDHALQVFAAALCEQRVDRLAARWAHDALRAEQHRLHAGRQTHLHLEAAGIACAQMAAGISPGRIKLAACVRILTAHLAPG